MGKWDNCKINVLNKEDSKKIQEKLFELGYAWGNGKLFEPNAHYLFLDSPYITYCSEVNYFNEHMFKEIFIKDILGTQLKANARGYI